MFQSIRRAISRKDEGASAVEYGLLVAGIAVVIIAAVFLLGNNIAGVFDKSGSCIASPTAAPC